MFGWEFPPYNSGGLGVACLGLTRALAAQSTEIIFVLPRAIAVKASYLKLVFADKKIKFKELDSPLTPYMTSDGYLKNGQSRIYGRDLFEEVRRYSAKGAEVAWEEEFDLIHAHDWLSFGAGLAAKRVSGKPLIVHVHATEFDRSGNNINQEIFNLEKEGMEKADGIIAVSNYTKNMIVSHYGIDPEKIQVVWNGIESDDYPNRQVGHEQALVAFKNAGCKLVLFVGRLTLQKGPDYFLLAAKKVLEYYPKVIFVIAGSGDMENQIVSQAASLGIGDKVLFAGFVRGEQLDMLYQSADLYVLSSVSEPFGITSLESMVNGTPVLVSKQSGAAEALTHALKADFWDIDEMANNILAVLNHSSLGNCLSENGKVEIKKFTWKDAAKKCLYFYNKIFQVGGSR